MRIVTRIEGDEIANAGATPQGNKNSPQVQAAKKEQVSVNPPAMTNDEVREALLKMAQAITIQAEAITAQPKMEVVPRENQYASTMARHF